MLNKLIAETKAEADRAHEEIIKISKNINNKYYSEISKLQSAVYEMQDKRDQEIQEACKDLYLKRNTLYKRVTELTQSCHHKDGSHNAFELKGGMGGGYFQCYLCGKTWSID